MLPPMYSEYPYSYGAPPPPPPQNMPPPPDFRRYPDKPVAHSTQSFGPPPYAGGGPTITEMGASEYGSTLLINPSGDSAQQTAYNSRLYKNQEQRNFDKPYETKTRSWKEVNDDVAARMTAASSDSPPIIPKRDYDDSSAEGSVRRFNRMKALYEPTGASKGPTPIITYDTATMNRAVELYKSQSPGEPLETRQPAVPGPFFPAPFVPPFPMMPFPYNPAMAKGPMLPPLPYAAGRPMPMDWELFSFTEANRQRQMFKRCGSVPGPMAPPYCYFGNHEPEPIRAKANAPRGKVADYSTNGKDYYTKSKRATKTSVCCTDWTQLVWFIVGIVVTGLIIGLILGLTLV